MNAVTYDLEDSAYWERRYTKVWGVESESRAGNWYTVALNSAGTWSCGCPRWTRNANRPECKHIRWVKHNLYRGGNYMEVPVAQMPEKVRKFLNTFAAIEVE